MVTLHLLSEEIRTILKWGGLTLVVITLLILFTGLGKRVKEIFAPTPPPPPTVTFGKLPQIQFPRSSKGSFTYSINTLTGTLPNFADRAKIYQVKQPQADLLALERAKDIVTSVGFDSQETKITSTVYEWSESVAPFRKLSLNIYTYDFALTSEYLLDESVLGAEFVPSGEQAIEEAKAFLSDLTAPVDSFDDEKTKTSFFSIVDGKLEPTTSLSSTQVIRVNFFQKNVDKLPVYYANPPFSTNFVSIAAGEDESSVVEARFTETDLGESSTYPIKTAQDAFKELQEGKAFIASSLQDSEDLQIDKVFLAYFSEGKAQEYFMPIVVFEGEGFVAYVSAVTDEWIE